MRERAEEGDDMDIAVEVEALRTTALRCALALCRERDTAEDLVQTAMLHMLQRRPPQVRTPLHARNYLLRCVEHAWVDELRRRRRLPALLPLECGEHVGACDQYDLPAGEDALQGMPPKWRAVVVARAMGMDYATVAAVVGIGVGTVRSRLHRARAWAREKTPAA